MKEALASYILRKLKKGGADDIVVSMTESTNNQIKFSNNKISTTKTWEALSLSVLIAMKKKLVTTTIKDFSTKAADKTVARLLELVKNTEENKGYMGIATGPFRYKKIDGLYDRNVGKLKESAVDIVDGCINQALKEKAQRTAGLLEVTGTENYLLTSGGVEAGAKATALYFSIRALAEKDASGHQTLVGRTLQRFKPERAAKKAAEYAVNARNPKKCNPGKFDCVFDHIPAANMLMHVGESASIFNVEAALSFLEGKKGKEVASDKVTIHDDATKKDGLASSIYDAEGVPTKKNVLIQGGVLKTYLHNTSTAKRYNTKTTANAGLIAPEPTNIVLKKGNKSVDEMIKEVRKGFFITNTWYTRFQSYQTGDFSTIPRDAIFYIENGRIKHPVKEIRVTENMLNLLHNINGVGNDQQQVYGWEVGIPVFTSPILVKNVRVTTSTT
ncbi:TldD/PmbA family protein [Candidatus Woesearchaeota archaeon]|nr:TldD/PmbA family protein [Candidatus Woesearchaeota archaeon]